MAGLEAFCVVDAQGFNSNKKGLARWKVTSLHEDVLVKFVALLMQMRRTNLFSAASKGPETSNAAAGKSSGL